MATLLTMGTVQAQSRMDNNMVGKMTKVDFERKNKEGAATVSAIMPDSKKLSAADAAMMKEVAMGGMMQLETSKVAVQKSTDPAVREFAQGEVDEQMGLSDKLKAIASAKGITLPATPDAETQQMVAKMQGMSGAELDRHYVKEHGVKGHEKLDKVMSKVKMKGTDDNLTAVAKAAHPLVKTHLKVAREMEAKMKVQ
ncbi:DUF4142 domain-containing protein [Fibrella sp. HMF5335]|uniref:DUF4142 domain-containing protein n=2 Tax=Fibrella rubiginis TaxID=2817060 RepID=A0A939GJ64_9BACT|nr:DUF4142 domain-containing protein [Fibrella rubiginis]